MTTIEKLAITVPGSAGLAACLYLPPSQHRGLPAITMAPGFGGVAGQGLTPFAERFAANGFAVLVHDHRTYGNSEGTPRQDPDPWEQIADWRRAISYLESRPEVDADRIGLWGTSFSGGHAIVLGATDRRLKAVVAQVPFVDGYHTGLRRVAPHEVGALEEAFDADERAQLAGEPPTEITLVDADHTHTAAYHASAAVDFYLRWAKTLDVPWENTVTLRALRKIRMYSPAAYVARVSPTPLLMVIAQNDTVSVADLSLAAYNQALEPKRLTLIPGDHFDPYLEEFEAATAAALSWFAEHLGATQ